MVRTVGRAGSGPGEFQRPYSLAFLANGGFAVSDLSLYRISLFDSTGAFRAAFPTPDQEPRVIAALPDGAIAVAGMLGFGAENQLLSVYDPQGRRQRHFMSVDTLVIKTDLVLDQPWLSVSDKGTLVAGMMATPTAEEYEVGGRFVRKTAAVPTGWRQLRADDKPKKGLEAIRQWIGRSSVSFGGGFPDDSTFLLGYASTSDVDSTTFAVFHRDFRPSLIVEPVNGRLLFVKRGIVAVGREDEGGSTRIILYRWNPRR